MTSIINIITRMRPKLALLCALMLACCCLAAPAQAEYVTNDALHLGIISVATNRVNPLTPVEREFMSVTNLMYEGLMSCLLYTSPSPRDRQKSRMPSSA